MKQEQIILRNSFNRHTITRGLVIGFVCLVGSIFFAIFFLLQIFHSKYRLFLKAAQLEHTDFLYLVNSLRPQENQEPIALLVLGTDELENRPGHPQLTDTILLIKIDPLQAQLNSVSLPRDLWSDPYQTKINALYEYGKERDPTQPTRFPQDVISEMTGVSIDQVVVVSLEQLGQIIDLFGDISVEVEEGFTDRLFPRSDVDISNTSDPAQLYETVEFEAGVQSMNSETALKYIRSRHSGDQATGNDLARGQRQQQVINALINQLSNPKVYWHRPQLAGELLAYYQSEFDQYLPLDQMLSFVINIARSQSSVQFHSSGLSVFPDVETGIIEHPKNLKLYQDQWVYIVRDQAEFQEFISQALD